MAGHSPPKTGVNALMSRPSRLYRHCARLNVIAGTSPAMTAIIAGARLLRRPSAGVEVLDIALLDGRHRQHDEYVGGAEFAVDDGAVADTGAEAEIALDQRRQAAQRRLRIDRFFRKAIHFDITL